MAQSNYDITLARMPGEFLKYDQQRMICMFCHDYDADHLYLRFLDRRYRVSRAARNDRMGNGRQRLAAGGVSGCDDDL